MTKAVLAVWLSATISLGVPVHPAGKDSVDPPNPAALHMGPVAPLNHSVTTTSSKYWTLSQDGIEYSHSPNAIMGKCAIINDGRCITSDPSATYEMLFDDQYCVFTAHKQLKVTATHFDMSPGYDFVIVAGEQFPPHGAIGSAGPTDVVLNEGQTVHYFGSKYNSRSGFTICASDVETTGYFHAVNEHADCRVVDNGVCIAAGFYYDKSKATYEKSIVSIFKVVQDLKVNLVGFETESFYDTLTIGGKAYSGDSGPATGTEIAAGTEITWQADASVERKGFKICATPWIRPPPPPPPLVWPLRIGSKVQIKAEILANQGVKPGVNVGTCMSFDGKGGQVSVMFSVMFLGFSHPNHTWKGNPDELVVVPFNTGDRVQILAKYKHSFARYGLQGVKPGVDVGTLTSIECNGQVRVNFSREISNWKGYLEDIVRVGGCCVDGVGQCCGQCPSGNC